MLLLFSNLKSSLYIDIDISFSLSISIIRSALSIFQRVLTSKTTVPCPFTATQCKPMRSLSYSTPPTYSAWLFICELNRAVAITSQENSQLWVGKLSGGCDGCFDVETAEFLEEEGAVYDFPRNANCEVCILTYSYETNSNEQTRQFMICGTCLSPSFHYKNTHTHIS